jgi:hypothetical protein
MDSNPFDEAKNIASLQEFVGELSDLMSRHFPSREQAGQSATLRANDQLKAQIARIREALPEDLRDDVVEGVIALRASHSTLQERLHSLHADDRTEAWAVHAIRTVLEVDRSASSFSTEAWAMDAIRGIIAMVKDRP